MSAPTSNGCLDGRELWTEVETLGSIRHKTIVNLYYCYFGADNNLLAKFLDDARMLLHNSSEWTYIALREVETLSIRPSSSRASCSSVGGGGAGEKGQVVGGGRRRVTAGGGRWWRPTVLRVSGWGWVRAWGFGGGSSIADDLEGVNWGGGGLAMAVCCGRQGRAVTALPVGWWGTSGGPVLAAGVSNGRRG
jgi:hypothetical protein